jgi:hypothetical protein
VESVSEQQCKHYTKKWATRSTHLPFKLQPEGLHDRLHVPGRELHLVEGLLLGQSLVGVHLLLDVSIKILVLLLAVLLPLIPLLPALALEDFLVIQSGTKKLEEGIPHS